MRMTIRYRNGMRTEAALLAASRETMRVTIEGQPDAIDLQKVDSVWRTESGEEIEIEALFPMPEVDVAQFCREVYPRTSAAGHGSLFI
jgi:hypothetical protein